jgi:hypothetical protein
MAAFCVSSSMDFTYGFGSGAGNNGSVVSIANNRDTSRSQTFAYDPLNRIASAQTSATTGPNCFGETFGYDGWANLLTIGYVTGYSGCMQENLGATANAQNQISANTYDAAGD